MNGVKHVLEVLAYGALAVLVYVVCVLVAIVGGAG